MEIRFQKNTDLSPEIIRILWHKNTEHSSVPTPPHVQKGEGVWSRLWNRYYFASNFTLLCRLHFVDSFMERKTNKSASLIFQCKGFSFIFLRLWNQTGEQKSRDLSKQSAKTFFNAIEYPGELGTSFKKCRFPSLP